MLLFVVINVEVVIVQKIDKILVYSFSRLMFRIMGDQRCYLEIFSSLHVRCKREYKDVQGDYKEKQSQIKPLYLGFRNSSEAFLGHCPLSYRIVARTSVRCLSKLS